MTRKIIVILILLLLAFYWLFDHYAPLPFNHESFGLYQHDIHRVLGVIFLIAAGLVAWKWKVKKNN